MSVRVSVVVPTCGRPDLLSRCLEALLAQDYDPGSFEIIVVDDCPSDAVHQVVNAWAESARLYYCLRGGRPQGAHGNGTTGACSDEGMQAQQTHWSERAAQEDVVAAQKSGATIRTGVNGIVIASVPSVRYIPMPRHGGPAAARNAGWQAARGEIIAFTDDDCVPSPEWLREGVAGFAPGVIAVSGCISIPLPDAPTDYELNCSRLAHSEFVTANCFYRRSVLKASGGFDERFRVAWREDSDLYFTLLERSTQSDQPVRLGHAPRAVVVHPVRPAPWGVSVRQQRKTMFNALLYKKHPRLYRERLGQVTPWHYYGIVAALLLVLVGLVLGISALASAAALVWFGMTAAFCQKRLVGTSHSPSHLLEMALTSVLIPPLAVYWRARGALRYRVWFL